MEKFEKITERDIKALPHTETVGFRLLGILYCHIPARCAAGKIGKGWTNL